MIALCCEYLSVRWIWLYVIIMSRMRFRVNEFIFHYSQVGVVIPPSVKKWPNLYPSESPPNFCILPHESLTPPYGYLKWDIKA